MNEIDQFILSNPKACTNKRGTTKEDLIKGIYDFKYYNGFKEYTSIEQLNQRGDEITRMVAHAINDDENIVHPDFYWYSVNDIHDLLHLINHVHFNTCLSVDKDSKELDINTILSDVDRFEIKIYCQGEVVKSLELKTRDDIMNCVGVAMEELNKLHETNEELTQKRLEDIFSIQNPDVNNSF